MPDPLDHAYLERLCDEAAQMGIITSEQVIANLESLIISHANYLNYRDRAKLTGSHNQTTYRQMLTAARAIKLLQQQQEGQA
jgi:hypothetical protein